MTKDEAIERLHEWIKPGDKLYTILRHVSASRMSRDISIVQPYVKDDGTVDIRHLDYIVAIALEAKLAPGNREGIRRGGCGMDMGFDLIYRLGQRMWPDGTPEPHGTRNGEPDRAGGYAIDQSWL